VLLWGWPAAAAPQGRTCWLDELVWQGSRQDYGEPRRGVSVQANPISIAGIRFRRGIGTHANSSVSVAADGKAARFTAFVGVDDEPKTHPGSVEFQVLGDGRVLWRSGVMKTGDPARRADVDLAGVRVLELRATDGGDGIDSDHADWADAHLVKGGTLPPLAAPVEFVAPEPCFEITATAFGRDCRDCTLYEDDGVSLDYERGAQNRVVLRWVPGRGGSVEREGSYPGTRCRIAGWSEAAPAPAEGPTANTGK